MFRKGALDGLRDQAQRGVSRPFAEGVVVAAELVYVEKEQRERPRIPRAGGPLPAQHLVEEGPTAQAGQPVGGRQRLGLSQRP